MQKTYVALNHFKDPQLGLITRRQLLGNLSEEKALEMKEKGLVSPVLQTESSESQTTSAFVQGSGDVTIDALSSAAIQEKESAPKLSKKNAAASKTPG